MQPSRLVGFVSAVGCLLSAFPVAAQDVQPFVCSRVDSITADLDPGFGWRASAFHVLGSGSFQGRLERATLDAADGLATNPTDWAALFAAPLGLSDDLGLGYDPELEGPLWIATRPAPAWDLVVQTDRGEVTVRLPDTTGTAFGAAFVVGADGSTWWGDADHDGVAVHDRLGWQEAMAAEHLGRSADDPAPDPGPPPEPGPAPSQGEAGAVTTRAFTVSADGSPVRLGLPDGSSLPDADLRHMLGESFDVLDEGSSVGSTAWRGATGRAFPLEARAQDLSDCSGWPEVSVEPGVLAVDPAMGRFAFSAGDTQREVARRAHFHQHWNAPNSLLVDGDLLYLTIGESDASLVVVDISDPAAPRLQGKGHAGWAYGVTLTESHVHVRNRDGIATFARPVEGDVEWLQYLEMSNGRPSTLRLRDGRLEAFHTDAITLLDITDPAAPVESDSVALPVDDAVSGTANRGLYAISEDLAIAPVEDLNLMRLYDVAEPLAPIHLSTFLYSDKLVPATSWLLHPDGGALYIGTSSDGLHVTDLSDLAWPWSQVAWRVYDVDPDDPIQPVDTTTGLSLVDGILYESGTYGWVEPDGEPPWDGRTVAYVRAFDVTDPLAPTLIEEWTDDSTRAWLGGFVEADGFQVTVQGAYGLRTVDLAAGTPFDYLGSYHVASQTTEVELIGDVALLTGYSGGGITAVDLSDPDAPEQLSYTHHGLDTYCLGVVDRPDGTWVYSSGKSTVHWFGQEYGEWRYTDMAVHDFTDPSAPVFLGFGESTLHLACDVHGELLVQGCKLWDVSEPAAPELLEDTCPATSEASAPLGDLLVYGVTRYELPGGLFDSGQPTWGATVYDAAIPSAPLLLSFVEVPGAIGGMLSTRLVVRGGVAWFTDGLGAVALDLSDPRQAAILDRVDLSAEVGDPESLDVAGDYLYVQAQHWAMGVFDISGGLSSASAVGIDSTHVAEITRLKGHQLLSATAAGLYLTDVPRSPDVPAGPLTVTWFPADEPPADPAACGDDDDDDSATPAPDCSCDASSEAGGALPLLALPLIPILLLGRRRP